MIIGSMDQCEAQIPPDGVELRAFPEEEKQGQLLSTALKVGVRHQRVPIFC